MIIKDRTEQAIYYAADEVYYCARGREWYLLAEHPETCEPVRFEPCPAPEGATLPAPIGVGILAAALAEEEVYRAEVQRLCETLERERGQYLGGSVWADDRDLFTRTRGIA